MKKYLFLLITAALPAFLLAQDNQNEEAEQIIITKKGLNSDKLNIVVDGDQITVNGKPVNKDRDADISVKRIKIKDRYNFSYPNDIDFSGLKNGKGQVFLNGMFNKAMLGVTTDKDDAGAKIVSVTNESAAQKAGLKEGDIITAVNNKKIEQPNELSEALRDMKPGDKITINYLRNGEKKSTEAALTKWSAPQVMTFNGRNNTYFNVPDMDNIFKTLPRNWDNKSFQFYNFNGPKLGIKVEDLDEGNGVKVLDVEIGSDAARAGLHEGDIIKEVNGNRISNTDDILSETRKAKAGETIKFNISRKGTGKIIDVELSKKIKTANL